MTEPNKTIKEGDLNKVNYNGKKEISNQIRYFKDRLVGYSELSYSDIYRITEVEKDTDPDYKITDYEALKQEAGKRYENIYNVIYNSTQYQLDENETNDEDDPSKSGDNMYGIFKSILALLTIFIIVVLSRRLKSGNYIKPSPKGSMNFIQFMGLFVIIIGFNYVIGQFMDIMRIKTQKMDNNTIKEIIDTIQDIKNDTKLQNTFIKQFLQKNYDIVKKDSTYNIKLTKTIDSFLKKQEQFMMKSENIGMKNSVFKQKVNKSLKFFNGKSTMEIAKELVISNNNYNAIRTINDTFQKKLKTFRYKDDMFYKKTNENDPEKENLQGIKLDEKSDTYKKIFESEGTFVNELTELSTYLNQPALPDIEKCLLSVVRINKYLAFLEHMGLPEYRSLKFEFLFKNTPELLTFFDLKDRYTFKDEIDVVMRLKANFEDCGNKELSSQSEFVNEKCSTYNTNQNEKIVNTYKDIIEDYTSQNNDIAVNRVHMFIKKINDEVVSKKDMTSKAKYDDVLDNITTIVREIFKYSDITKKDLILLFKTEIKTTDDTVSNPDIFMNNIRKVLDIVFLNLEEYKKNHSILYNNKNSIKRQEYIVFDQFLHKIADYEEKDYTKLENELNTLSSYVDQIVIYRSENSIDVINKKKIKLFEEVVYIYITASLPFLIDFILRSVYGNTDCEDDEEEAKGNTQSGGASLGANVVAQGQKLGANVVTQAKGLGAEVAEKAQGAVTNATTQGQGAASQAKRVVTNVKSLSATGNESILTKIKNARGKLDSKLGIECPINVLNISVYFSGWLFSVIVLYTYWLKMDTQLSYNISVKLANSADINNALMNVKAPVSKLKESKSNEYENKKELYEAIIELLELQSKCNLLTFNEDSIPFPTTEIILTLFLIFLCCAVIISQNLLNNPFEAMRKIKMIQRSQKNKKYIANRTQIVDLVKSLMKDALDAKSERINKLLKLVDSSDEDSKKEIKESRSSLQSKIKSLDIENYNSNAMTEINGKFPNSKATIEPIVEKVKEYKESTTNSELNQFNELYNTLDNIDSIYDEYKSALDRLRKKELISNEQQGGLHDEGLHDDEHIMVGGNQQGGNPLMMNPYGMNFINNSEQIKADYKLESMKEMMKYTEEEENMLNELKQLDNSIMDINSTFTNITLAFGLISFSVFVSYKIMNNSLNFKSELFNGKLFGEGICYK